MENDDPSAERIPDTRSEVAEVTFMLPKDKLRLQKFIHLKDKLKSHHKKTTTKKPHKPTLNKITTHHKEQSTQKQSQN